MTGHNERVVGAKLVVPWAGGKELLGAGVVRERGEK